MAMASHYIQITNYSHSLRSQACEFHKTVGYLSFYDLEGCPCALWLNLHWYRLHFKLLHVSAALRHKRVHQKAWRGWRAELGVNKSSNFSVTFLSGFQCIALIMSFLVLALNINMSEVSTAFILPSDWIKLCHAGTLCENLTKIQVTDLLIPSMSF